MNSTRWNVMLQARPIQNHAARVELGRDGTVSVWVRQTQRLRPPLAWIVPFRKERLSRLDSIGRNVWSLCDGRRTVEDIVDEMAAQYRLSFHESRVAVTGYLKRLVHRGVVAIEMAEGGV